ncbi:unnamed protein product, partial [Meganyctiphanes norvegica]
HLQCGLWTLVLSRKRLAIIPVPITAMVISNLPLTYIAVNLPKPRLKLAPITFSSSYGDLIPKLEIKNNGHTVGASWDSSLDLRTITDGGLTGVYALAQFHFHWGL